MPPVQRSRIFDNGNGSASSWSPSFRIPHGRRRVGSLLGRSPWMAEEAMDWWLPCSSIFFCQSRRPASFDPISTLLECRATPRPRPSMPPSAWWSSLINWACGCTRMMIKLQDLYCYFLQAFAVRYSGWHDCRKQPGLMAWPPRAAAVMPRRTATAGLGCSLPSRAS